MRTPARVAVIASALRAGNTRAAAAAYGSVTSQTFWTWMQDDRPIEGDENGLTFMDVVLKAEADAEVAMMARVMQAAQMSWQAAAWWLERRRQADFALRRVELTGADGGPVAVSHITTGMDDHERAALRRVLDEAIAARTTT